MVGGYDPSLAPQAYTDPSLGVEVVVRGEGDVTFREILRAIDSGTRTGYGDIAGLTYRQGASFVDTPPRPVSALDTAAVRLPDRSARVLPGYTLLGRPVDVVETSRGCTFDCSFCSIIEMRGRNFHRFPLSRVLADIVDARARGAGCIFFVDDNITLDMPRFEELCRAIVARGLNDVEYFVQGMTSSIAKHGNTIAPLMRQAGFRYVFLGIENILDDDLAFLRAAAKNRTRSQNGDSESATLQAIDHLHRHGMYVVGGLIVGNPDDTRESIEANLTFARRYIDWPYIQHPTPYPGTPMTQDFEARALIVNDRLEDYDGTTAVVKTAALEADEIEFLRWRGGAVDEAGTLSGRIGTQPRVRHAARAGDAARDVPRVVRPVVAGVGGRPGGLRSLSKTAACRTRIDLAGPGRHGSADTRAASGDGGVTSRWMSMRVRRGTTVDGAQGSS